MRYTIGTDQFFDSIQKLVPSEKEENEFIKRIIRKNKEPSFVLIAWNNA